MTTTDLIDTTNLDRDQAVLDLLNAYETHVDSANELQQAALMHPAVAEARDRANAEAGGYRYVPAWLTPDQYLAAAGVQSQLAVAAATMMQALTAAWNTPQ